MAGLPVEVFMFIRPRIQFLFQLTVKNSDNMTPSNFASLL